MFHTDSLSLLEIISTWILEKRFRSIVKEIKLLSLTTHIILKVMKNQCIYTFGKIFNDQFCQNTSWLSCMTPYNYWANIIRSRPLFRPLFTGNNYYASIQTVQLHISPHRYKALSDQRIYCLSIIKVLI